MNGDFHNTWELVRNIVLSIPTTRPLEDHVKLVESSVIFWVKLFGPKGADTFSDFLSVVCAGATNIINQLTPWDTGSTTKMDITLPPSVDNVVAAYREQRKSMGTAQLSWYVTYMLKANFYRHYEQLLDQAGRPDSDVRKRLEASNLGTSVGRSWASVVNDFILIRCHGFAFIAKTPKATVARRSLKNEIAHCHTYYLLEKVFGKGVFPLLPEHGLNE